MASTTTNSMITIAFLHSRPIALFMEDSWLPESTHLQRHQRLTVLFIATKTPTPGFARVQFPLKIVAGFSSLVIDNENRINFSTGSKPCDNTAIEIEIYYVHLESPILKTQRRNVLSLM